MSGNAIAKGEAEVCDAVVGVTQNYGLTRNEHQLNYVSRYVSQQSYMNKSAYNNFDLMSSTHQACDVAMDVDNQFVISPNSMPSLDMRHLNQSFDTHRNTQFDMAHSSLQHHFDMPRDATHITQPFEPHRGEGMPFSMPRGPLGHEMGRNSLHYGMPRTQSYEVRPTHPQQAPQHYCYDKGLQEGLHRQDISSAKEDCADAQLRMEMPLEMPKTAPQLSTRSKSRHKTSEHPFDFAKGYAQQLELAKKAAQNAIEAKIKARGEREQDGDTLAEKADTEGKKSQSNIRSSEILKLYSQQLQMTKDASRLSKTIKTFSRPQEVTGRVGSMESRITVMQNSHYERLGKRKASALSLENNIREEEKNGGDHNVTGVADDGETLNKSEENTPRLGMSFFLAQQSSVEYESSTQAGQNTNMAENTSDHTGREENMSHSPSDATNFLDDPLPLECRQNHSLSLEAPVRGNGGVVKRDRQELTLANKVKLIEQVESRGSKKKADVGREWGVRPSTLSTILKNKDKILTQFKSQRYGVGRRRMRTAAYPDVEEALLMWFRFARAAGVPITGPVLQGMGVTLAQELGHPGFSCSVGWLDRFKARHGLTFNPKSNQDAGTFCTFNEPQDRVLNPIVSSSNDVILNNSISSHSMIPSMLVGTQDVASEQVKNSSLSLLSNTTVDSRSTVDEDEEHLEKWFPENFDTEEYAHSETTEDQYSSWLHVSVPALLKEKHARDIFSAGETALFYNLLPDKMVTLNGEEGHKWTWVKERVTVLVAVNMDGSEKLPLLVVGQKPSGKTNGVINTKRAFALAFETNDSAMMTSELFESWLHQLDEQYRNLNRTITIIVENCSTHARTKALRNVKLLFLPSESTSRLQAVEQGVIHGLKSMYRQSVLEKMVNSLEAGSTFELTLHNAMMILQQSWKQIKAKLIIKSFQRAGLQTNEDVAECTEPDLESAVCLLDRARCLGHDVPSEVTFESYAKIDSEVQTTVDQEGESDLPVGSESVVDPTSPDEALHALAVLKKFCLEQGGPASFMDSAMDFEKWIAGHIVKTEEFF